MTSYRFLLLFVLTLCTTSCITPSEPLPGYVTGEIQDMNWDENGFLRMHLRMENDTVLRTLTDITYINRYPDITKALKPGQIIEIKGIKNCPVSFGTIFNRPQENCYVEIRAFRLPNLSEK